MEIINRLFSENFIEALGWTVLHSLWQATLIAIIIGCILLSIPKKSAIFRYRVATTGMLAILLCAIATFVWIYIDNGPLLAVIYQPVNINEKLLLLEETTVVRSLLEPSQMYFHPHLPLIVGIWLLGFAIFLFRLMGGLLYIQHLRFRSVHLKEEKWLSLLHKLSDQLSSKKIVGLAESAMIQVPMVIGHIKPLILFPIGMINHLTTKEVEAILAHELAHIYRNDYLINIIQSLIETLFYYHPAVWWLSWIIQTEREHCCDDIAVCVSGNSLTYAKALVRLQELSQHPGPAFAMSFAGRKNQLLTRIQRLLNHPQKNSNFMEKLIATGLLTLAVCLLSLHADSKKPAKEASSIESPIAAEKPMAINSEKAVVVPNHKPAKIIPLNRKTPLLPSIQVDTVPSTSKKSNHYSYYFNDGQTYEVASQNGEITSMKVNGEEIPAEDYEQYESQFQKKERGPKPPMPPMPPFPSGLPAPPTPPTPPVLPGFSFDKSTSKIKKEIDEDGNSILIIESDEREEPIKIKITGDVNSSLFIDGEELSEGEVVLLEEDLERYLESSIAGWIDNNSDYFEGEIEEWGEEFGERMGKWGEEFGKSVEQWFESNDKRHITKEEWENHLEERDIMKEEYLNDLDNLIEESKIEKMELQEEQREELEQLREEMELKKEEYRERLREIQEEKREREEELEERTTLFGDHLRESIEEGLKDLLLDEPNFKANRLVYEQLLKDGFAKDGRRFSYKLTSQSIKINGKKQSTATHQKYLKIYEQGLGRKLTTQRDLSILLMNGRRFVDCNFI